jgi:hypothetical protein
MYILDIIIVTFLTASSLFFGAQLFRFSLRHYWMPLAAAALISAIFNVVTGRIMGWDSLRPLMTLILQAAMVHVIFKISKWHALLLSFLGIITYTLFLGLAFFLNHSITGTSYHDIFFDDAKVNLNQPFAVIIMVILTAVMSRYRLGFTIVSDSKGSQKSWRQQKKFTIIFILSIIIFSVAYYATTIQIYYLFWAAVGFLISLIVLVLYLYHQEMEGD